MLNELRADGRAGGQSGKSSSEAAAAPSLNAESRPVRCGHAVMRHFDSMTNEDGSIAEIVRDGVLDNGLVTSEPADQIVRTYFKIAAADLAGMKNGGGEQCRR
jgi:hypothetical protein